MRTLKSWQWQKTDHEDIGKILGCDAYLYNIPRYKIVGKMGRHSIAFCPNSGDIDEVYLYTDDKKTELYVLCINRGLPYIGLDLYELINGELMYQDCYYGIFLQEGESYEALGDKWESLTPLYLAKILLNMVQS
jgi:hypothetical protein